MSSKNEGAFVVPTGSRALIADDSTATRQVLRSVLEILGLEVVEARDGSEAFKLLEERFADIDIVLSDINMPGLDGFELFRRLRDASWFQDTPFVLVSTQSDAQSVIRGLKMGADDYIPKPFDQELVAQVITTWNDSIVEKDLDKGMSVISEDFSNAEAADKAAWRSYLEWIDGAGYLDNAQVDTSAMEIAIDGDTATAGPMTLTTSGGVFTLHLTLAKEEAGWMVVSSESR